MEWPEPPRNVVKITGSRVLSIRLPVCRLPAPTACCPGAALPTPLRAAVRCADGCNKHGPGWRQHASSRNVRYQQGLLKQVAVTRCAARCPVLVHLG